MNYEKVLGEHKFPTYEELKSGLIRLIDEGKISREDAARLLPELRESEDERIRKKCIELIKRVIPSGDSQSQESKEILDCIAYLEKQKEQKHPNGCFTCDEYKKGYEEGRRNGFTAGYNKAMKEVEQKEQKPWKVGANAYFTPEHKPAEWSEEDETRLTNIIIMLEEYLVHHYSKDDIDKSVAWLKSLRPQPQGTYKLIVHNIYEMLKDKDFFDIPPSHRVSLLNDIRVRCKNADEQAEILDVPSM